MKTEPMNYKVGFILYYKATGFRVPDIDTGSLNKSPCFVGRFVCETTAKNYAIYSYNNIPSINADMIRVYVVIKGNKTIYRAG